ncbi:sensor histidine kinase [Paenibacillus ginsengarvi]|uniref:histidine kinase n=1 Tax=Paenibacillus ginsengarvi TaxID=400777 RepID=A0A3B0BSH4_9BACL|nr:sensor histidine kinase [Paenibacillus ginsengarvi]RKN75790.1 sensor histidine kinase [Paenibacillus ginsengarvi]
MREDEQRSPLQPELWAIGNKAVLLGYVIAAAFLNDPSSAVASWHMLVYLLYLAINVTILIFKAPSAKWLLAAASVALAVYAAFRLEPLLLLLLPANLCELAERFARKRLAALLLVLFAVLLVPYSLIPSYLLCGLLSYLLYAYGGALSDKLGRLEKERERMRADLQRLARMLSENHEYIRQSEYTIKLEERNRLSQQIHDDVGHAMAGALFQMEASRLLMQTNRDKASELLGNAISISKEGLERIRQTLKDMKPRAEELGVNRLRLFVDELSAKETVTATLSCDGDIDVITPIQWKIIQQNATEAVTNALKYAKASAIHIEIRVLNKFIKAVVSDNGVGAEKVVKGLGIVGMEERAASVGGTVIVDGAKGFSVTTLLPYESR